MGILGRIVVRWFQSMGAGIGGKHGAQAGNYTYDNLYIVHNYGYKRFAKNFVKSLKG